MVIDIGKSLSSDLFSLYLRNQHGYYSVRDVLDITMVYVINTGKTLSRSDVFDDLYQPIWIRRPSSQVTAAFPAYVEEILTDLLSSVFDLVAWILVSAVSAVMLGSSNSH